MTPTLQRFIQEFGSLGGETDAWSYDEGPPPRLRHPAAHPDVGCLHIYDDGDELTVCLDKKHHSHIATYNYLQEPEAERLNLVASETARFVADIMADRILFTVDFVGAKFRGSSHVYLDENRQGVESLRTSLLGIRGGNIRTERYVWSQPCDPDVG